MFARFISLSFLFCAAEVFASGMGRSGMGGEKPPAKPKKWLPGGVNQETRWPWIQAGVRFISARHRRLGRRDSR